MISCCRVPTTFRLTSRLSLVGFKGGRKRGKGEKGTELKKRSSIMASAQEREKLDHKAREGETVVPGGTGGKSLEAQEHLAEGRSRGGQTRRDQLGSEGYEEMGSKGGQTRREQLGTEGYKELGSKGGQTRKEQLGTEGYKEMGSKGGQTRKEQLGTEGYQEMGRKGGLTTMDKSGGERAEEEGIYIDESKFRTSSS